MQCSIKVGSKADPRALALHFAAHVVLMRKYRIPVTAVSINEKTRKGRIVADIQRRPPDTPRVVLEHDAIAVYAGSAAQAWVTGFQHNVFAEWDEGPAVDRILRPFATDENERTHWAIYLQERARRALCGAGIWVRIDGLATHLIEQRRLDGPAIDRFFASFVPNEFLMVSKPWFFPHPEEVVDNGKGNAVLIWSEPTLSQTLGMVER
jgi:hypothetical protein